MEGSESRSPRGGPKRHSRNVSSTSAQRMHLNEGDFDPLSEAPALPERPLPSPARSPRPSQDTTSEGPKDFSHIVRLENFHPLSNNDIPAPFRDPDLSSLPDSHDPEALVKAGYFRAAAVQAVKELTAPESPPPETIFELLHIRLTCLTLINQFPLAAQESRCLQDLSSPFYLSSGPPRRNILPWELRVLATRLQGFSIGDPRKIVMGYFDLAKDARRSFAEAPEDEKALWQSRLTDVGVRIANALVEMGDLTTAISHLQTLDVESISSKERQLIRGRLALLYLRVGNLGAARSYIVGDGESDQGSYADTLRPLLSAAEGNYSSAAAQLSAVRDASNGEQALATTNLAVALLYTGELQKARALLEELLEAGMRFSTLLFNLSTMFELCTEKAKSLKTELVEKVAKQTDSTGYERASADFKY